MHVTGTDGTEGSDQGVNPLLPFTAIAFECLLRKLSDFFLQMHVACQFQFHSLHHAAYATVISDQLQMSWRMTRQQDRIEDEPHRCGFAKWPELPSLSKRGGGDFPSAYQNRDQGVMSAFGLYCHCL